MASVSSVSPVQDLPLVHLPPELISLISSFLTNKDRKSLRLTCKTLSDLTLFSFPRVFLSSNSLNIKVFRAVADHPKFRRQVTEIIWDDARFVSAPLFWEGIPPPPNINRESLKVENGCPRWFAKACEDNVFMMQKRRHQEKERPDHVARQNQLKDQLPLSECWAYYSDILNDQKEVVKSQDDEKAFIYGLERFPGLKRVTVTPATHGWLYSPLYETPMIREFPYGFNYPIARGWQIGLIEGEFTNPAPDNPLPWTEATEEYKEEWRGARIALRVLSMIENHKVSELKFDSKDLPIGINCTIFDKPCDEYHQLVAILARPGFQSLGLSLHIGHSLDCYEESFQSGLLYEALSAAKALTHIDLSTTLVYDSPEDESLLNQILPIEKWPNLRHFGISRFNIKISQLVEILKLLPDSLESVDLGLLNFLDHNEGLWHGLLEKIRDEVGWQNREKKPTVILRTERLTDDAGRFIRVVKEVNEFLYGEGENPAEEEVVIAKPGRGMMIDLFEPEYTRPTDI